MTAKQLTTDIAQSIRNKANAMAPNVLTPLEWGKKYVPQFFFRKGCKFHDDISDTLHQLSSKRGQKVLCMAPRGNAKSTICSTVVPLKAICESTEKYILLISDTADQARKYLKTIADELDNNEAIRAKYPLACKHGDVWNRDVIETKNGVCVEAIGKGGGVRGKKFKQYRPTLVILDDPQNDEDVLSPSTRSKDIDWFNKALMQVGDKETNYFLIGTNLHRECIVNMVSQRSDYRIMRYSSIIAWPTAIDTLWKDWKHIFLVKREEEAEKFYIENKAAMDEGAVVLWPEKESLYDLMVMIASAGMPAFMSEKQNSPRDPSKCEFDESWFGDDVWYDELPTTAHDLICVGYCDPATGGQTKRHDYSACIGLFYDVDAGVCYVKADIKRRPVSELTDAIVRFCKVHRPLAYGVEANGFQHMVGDEIVAKNPLAPVTPIDNHGVHKNTRISRLSIWFERKFFRFQRGCRSTMLLMQQILDHPGSDHDDGPDALEGAIRVLTEVSDLDTPMSSDDSTIDDDGIGDNIFDKNPYMAM